jgi:hypothetical protein
VELFSNGQGRVWGIDCLKNIANFQGMKQNHREYRIGEGERQRERPRQNDVYCTYVSDCVLICGLAQAECASAYISYLRHRTWQVFWLQMKERKVKNST